MHKTKKARLKDSIFMEHNFLAKTNGAIWQQITTIHPPPPPSTVGKLNANKSSIWVCWWHGQHQNTYNAQSVLDPTCIIWIEHVICFLPICRFLLAGTYDDDALIYLGMCEGRMMAKMTWLTVVFNSRSHLLAILSPWILLLAYIFVRSMLLVVQPLVFFDGFNKNFVFFFRPHYLKDRAIRLKTILTPHTNFIFPNDISSKHLINPINCGRPFQKYFYFGSIWWY